MDSVKIKKIIELGRFRFLVGGFLLYVFGFLLALISKGDFSIDLFIFGYVILFPAHLSLSYSNNYFDADIDKYNKTLSISGGSKILIKNPELKKTCKNISIFLVLMSITSSIFFVIIYSYQVSFIFFVVFGNLLGWFYSAPPFRLAYNGLGEIANMINMGILMPGLGYLIVKNGFDSFFYLFSIALFIYGLIFIIIVEMPDMEGDIKGKKLTLITRIGRKSGYKILIFSSVISSMYFLMLSILKPYNEYINFITIFLLSLIPLIVILNGWFDKPFTRKNSIKVAQNNVYTLFFFIAMINIYLSVTMFV